jgi:uncharacterized damage-inducible protein DinB
VTFEDVIADLMRHMEWADALVWKTVIASPSAATNEVIRDRLHHLHNTQHAFLQVWQKPRQDLPGVNPLDVDIDALARWARSFYERVVSDESTLNEESLHRRIPDSLLQKAEQGLGPGASLPGIGDTVLQVVLHSAYHRGQINKKLRELGCEPPLTEYFIWVWRGRPRPEWPLETESAPDQQLERTG